MAEFSHFSFLAAIMIAVGLAADDPQTTLVGVGCKQKTYVNSTAFQENQSVVFASLLSNLSSHAFATSMQKKFGETDPVFGLAVCRKYLSARECSECVKVAETQLKGHCPRSNAGNIHLDGCFLRYKNLSFYGQAIDPRASFYCDSTNASDPPYIFRNRVEALLAQLKMNVSASNASYSVGSFDGLYGLAQCWPSLNTSSCQECLTEAQNHLISCGIKQEGRGIQFGCFMRYSNYSFFTDKDNEISLSTDLTAEKSSSNIVPILVGSFGGAGLFAMLCLVFYQRIRHRKGYDRKVDYASRSVFRLGRICYKKHNVMVVCGDENFGTSGNFGQVFFDYKVLRDSTGNFDRSNMLGKGGFGEVYKGRIPDGRDVAVKKLNGRHETTPAAEEFLTEVKLLTNVRHRNLVRLLGCCTRRQERLLVYEFMSNNSLHKHLFETRSPLSWETRLNITVGTARGLAYLHEDSNVRIIHRDIKCGNILLDDRFHPKIADFGLARFFPEGQTHVSTRVGGTIGYTAPEYAVHGQLTEKADIYSYGIVVLEIVSGRKCVDVTLPAPMHLLLEWAWNLYKRDRVLDIVDPALKGQYPREQAIRVITVALLCTQGSSALRPAMSQVGLILTNNSDIPAQPTQPAFIDVAAARYEDSPAVSEATGSAAAPSEESHGYISVSLHPR